MRRGDLWFADLSPPRGSVAAKRRPVLIVSNDANNRASSTLTVLPVTSSVERVYPFEVALAKGKGGLAKSAKAQAQQIRTIARERLSGKRIGTLDAASMAKVDEAIRLHLALD